MRALLLLCFSLLLVSCSRNDDPYAGYAQRTGDLVPFVLAHAIGCGGHPKTTNGLPVINATWKFKEDANGVQIYADGGGFQEFEKFLTGAFGEPDASKGSKVADLQEARTWKWFGWYSVRDIGVGIQYFGSDREFGVIIIRPQKF
jgi:hypothetical protein